MGRVCMGRVCMGRVCYGPSLLCAELTRYRDDHRVMQALHSFQEHPTRCKSYHSLYENAQKYTSPPKTYRFEIYIIESIVSLFIPLFSVLYRITLKKKKRKGCQKQKKCTELDSNRRPTNHESDAHVEESLLK